MLGWQLERHQITLTVTLGVALTTRAANEPSEMVLQGPYAYTTRVREADTKVISNKGWAGWLA